MDDSLLWNLGSVRVRELLAGIPGESAEVLAHLLARYRLTKKTFAEIVTGVGASLMCEECGGQCCLNGKYRISIYDFMACLDANHPISVDFSQKPLCPYGTAGGCNFEPDLRPADCIIFICSEIDQRLTPQARLLVAEQERMLRECIKEASCLIGVQMGTPLLLWAGHAASNPTKVRR